MNTLHFPRAKLASDYADELLGKRALSDAPNGLFLTGVRRTGKSAFLRFDLIPALTTHGVLALYVDLLTNKKLQPMEVVRQALQQAVVDNLSAIEKFAKNAGLEKIGLPGVFGVDLRNIGNIEALSLYQVFELLARARGGKPIALIIDEAQQALTSDEDDTLMWALKSARDQMKTPSGANLLLVMSGSHTDKLTLLLGTPRAPFWGSQVRALPLLGDDFVEAQAAALRQAQPTLATVRTSELVRAFEQFGRRPQFFLAAAGEAAASSHDAQAFEAALVARSQRQTAADYQRYSDAFLALPALEQAVLERIITEGRQFRAFDAKALAFYAQRTGKAKVTAAAVQRAVEALRANEEDLVWKSLRGDYAIYDQGLITWHACLVAQRAWPPTVAPSG